jgi:hypothetical protein
MPNWIVNQPPVFAALIQAIGTIAGALIIGVAGTLLTRWLAIARDRQDRESQWRTHAVELTKLDIQRKIETWKEGDPRPRPAILDFLANYRDLQELGKTTPKDLYLKIEKDRITAPSTPPQGGATPAHAAHASSVSSEPSASAGFRGRCSFFSLTNALHRVAAMLRFRRN